MHVCSVLNWLNVGDSHRPFAHTFWLKRVCLSSTDEPNSSDHHSPIILIILLCFCGTLIGWGWGNLPPQTCFLPDPGARSVFLTNYRLPSEMICNSSQWITLPSAVCVTCQYPLSFSDISGGYFGGRGKWSDGQITPFTEKSSVRLMSAKQQSSGSSGVDSPSLCYIANAPSQHLCC